MVGSANKKNRIEELRRGRGFTQEQLAALCDTTHSTIQRLEKGTMRLTERWIGPLSKALRCHPGELFSELPTPSDDPDIAEVISKARLMDPTVRAQWLQMADVLMGAQPQTLPTAKTKRFKS